MAEPQKGASLNNLKAQVTPTTSGHKTVKRESIGHRYRHTEERGKKGDVDHRGKNVSPADGERNSILAMTEAEGVVGIMSASDMLEQLGKAFIELKSNRDASTKYETIWEEIKGYFTDLENSLRKKLEETEEKEKAFEEKAFATLGLVSGREADVAAKEQASLDRIQELKDAAVAAIAEARKNYKVASPERVDIVGDKQKKVSSSANSDHNASIPGTEEKSPDNRSGGIAEATTADVQPHPQLKDLCEQMDAKGLLKFLYDNRKNLVTIRGQVPIALKSANDPARLVLDSLEGFYPPDQPTPGGNEDTALLVLRRTCVSLMEAAAPLLGVTEPSGEHPLSSENKQQAKAIADEWNSKLDGVDIDAANGNSLEAQAFLQLLATFNIAPEFDEDKLCKFILAVSRRRQAPELCRSLGLTHKMPGVIEALISSDRHVDAVHFIHAFQLTESFPPVPLLRAYSDKNSSQEKSGHDGPPGTQDAGALELGALRAVIRCIEEYSFQTEYPPGPLRKRVAELEKAKADKKRSVGANKFHAKKPRGSGYTPRGPTGAPIGVDYRQAQPRAFDERGLHAGGSERHPYSVLQQSYNYQIPAHTSYGSTSYGPTSYGSTLAASFGSTLAASFGSASYGPTSYGSQASVQSQRPYYYPDERAPPTSYGSSNYGDYTSAGLQSSHQSYM